MEKQHQGKTWRDMPGSTHDNKKMNFALFRRGKLTLEYVEASAQKRSKMNMKRPHTGGL